MPRDPTIFAAWQAAEQMAREAETRYFKSLCKGESADPEETARMRALRAEAGVLLRRTLEDIRVAAESLRPDALEGDKLVP